METMISIIPTFDSNLNCNILVRKTITIDGDELTKNWRCVLEKDTPLTGLVFETSFGAISLADFPAEMQYIAAKWA